MVVVLLKFLESAIDRFERLPVGAGFLEYQKTPMKP